MIRMLNGDDLPSMRIGWESTYITSRLLAYGSNASFAPFYVDESGTVLSILNAHAVMYAENPDPYEWATFLSMHPDIVKITAPLTIAKRLAEILDKTVSEKKVMRLQGALPVPTFAVTEPSPRYIYPLLSHVFGDTMPAFDGWYVDVSHRVRHENCTIAAVERDDTVVSTAMTVAQTPYAVVIGAVATAPTARKQGLAAGCIGYLAHKHIDKTIMISPKNPYAEQLYETLGFAVSEILGEISIEG